LESFGEYGASRVLSINNDSLKSFVNQAYASIIAQVAVKTGASTIIMSNSFSAKGMAPRVAVKLKAAFGEAVVSLPEIQGQEMTIKRGVFSGKAFVFEKLASPIKVITLSPNSFGLVSHPVKPILEEITADLPLTDFGTLIKEIIRNTDKISLPDAERVVSAGRGLKGPENWKMIEDLAEVLGAATACSKPVSDAGWRPHSEHVGQTGIAVSPNLYIAIGISGAIQHLAGVSSSKVIVVINKDPEAPFFKVADYGIVGDAFEVVPRLIQAAKTLKG
jgi:electron transfer flavoprotein alpha subunit